MKCLLCAYACSQPVPLRMNFLENDMNLLNSFLDEYALEKFGTFFTRKIQGLSFPQLSYIFSSWQTFKGVVSV